MAAAHKKKKRERLIAFHPYYDLNYDTNDLGHLRFKELIRISKERLIRFTKYKSKKHNYYDAILLVDIPKPIDLIKIIFKAKFQKYKKVILVLEETSISRKRFIINIPFLFDAIFINTIEKKLKHPFYPIFCYKHSCLEEKVNIVKDKEQILKGKRPKSLCYIGKNNNAYSKLTTYRAKQKIISSFNYYPNKLSLYGYDWEKIIIPIDFPLKPILVRISILNKIIKSIFSIIKRIKRTPKISSLGIATSKLEVYSKHDFSLAFEPFIGRPYVLLEKIFDPMKAGCIPLYFGNKNINDLIPSDTFIRIGPFDDAKTIIDRISKLSEEEKQSYRENIFNFLKSDKANQFRYENVSNIFIDNLLKIIED